MVMMTEEWFTKIVNFMTPGSWAEVWPYKLYSEHTLFKNLYSQAQIRQTEGTVMISKEESTKIVNFMTPRVGILLLGNGQISYIVKMHYFFKNLSLHSGIDQTN